MYNLDAIQCGGAQSSNTGNLSCEFKPQNITGVILTASNKSFTQAEIEVMDVTLAELFVNDTKSLRAFPIKPFTSTTSNNSEDVTTTTDYGTENFVRDGKIGMSFRMDEGLCYWKKLRSFHQQQTSFKAILIDEVNNVLWGSKSGDNFAGFSLQQLAIPPFTPNTGAEVFFFMIDLQFKNIKEFEKSTIIQFGEDINVMDLATGMLDVDLKAITTISGAGVVQVQAFTGCGAVNMYDVYSTNLSNGAAWLARNKSTGNAITVTTVTAVPGAKSFSLDLDTADPDYPTSGNSLEVYLAAPSVLSAAPVLMSGFEGSPLTIVIP